MIRNPDVHASVQVHPAHSALAHVGAAHTAATASGWLRARFGRARMGSKRGILRGQMILSAGGAAEIFGLGGAPDQLLELSPAVVASIFENRHVLNLTRERNFREPCCEIQCRYAPQEFLEKQPLFSRWRWPGIMRPRPQAGHDYGIHRFRAAKGRSQSGKGIKTRCRVEKAIDAGRI